jgi:hypothetical protein
MTKREAAMDDYASPKVIIVQAVFKEIRDGDVEP